MGRKKIYNTPAEKQKAYYNKKKKLSDIPLEAYGNLRIGLTKFPSIIEYFTYLTGLIPTEDQKTFLLDLANIDIKKQLASAGRQSGKTICSAVGVLWWIFQSGYKVKILLVSAQDNILYFHIREIFKQHPELVKELTSTSFLSPNIIPIHGFETLNKCIVTIKGTTDRNIRGIPADIVFLDETCSIRNDAILTALGNLSGPISKFVLLSTPHDNKSKFIEWANDKDSGFIVYTWSSEGLSWHPKELQATKKREMSSAKYAVEVLGRPPLISESTFFKEKYLDKMFSEELSDTPEYKPLNVIWGGLDTSYGEVCKISLTFIEKSKSKMKVIFNRNFDSFNIEEIDSYVQIYKPRFFKVDSRPSDLFNLVKTYIKKTKVIEVDYAKYKRSVIEQLRTAVRTGMLSASITEFKELYKELLKYHPNKRTGDDRVDSLALAVFESAELMVDTPRCVVGPWTNNPNYDKELRLSKLRQGIYH
jgi:hypothetical protein